MQMKGIFDVTEFGAGGIGTRVERLEINPPESFREECPIPYGTTQEIHYPVPGAELDSVGIQRAIDAAHAAGGGMVRVPAGDYLIAPIQLKSRVHLQLAPGARLWGSTDLQHYLAADGPNLQSVADYGSKDALRFRYLIDAVDAEDVALTGDGQISAQSGHWFIPWFNACSKPPLMRPRESILFRNCRNVRVEDIRLIDTPGWSLVFDDCNGVGVRGIQIHSLDVNNSDGIDLSGTSNVTISDCRLHTTDDSICLKAVRPESIVRNVTVTNCIIRCFSCNALKLGTESLGTFEDIAFSNIVIASPDEDLRHACGGINLNVMDGGSIRRVSFSNIIMRNVLCPFYLVVGKRSERLKRLGREPRAGSIEDVLITGLTAEAARHPSFIVGQPDGLIRRVRLENIRVRKTRGAVCQMPASPVPERPEAYPCPWMFGGYHEGDGLPAYGLYLRHAQDVQVSNTRFDTTTPDARPAVKEESSAGVSIEENNAGTGLAVNLPPDDQPAGRKD